MQIAVFAQQQTMFIQPIVDRLARRGHSVTIYGRQSAAQLAEIMSRVDLAWFEFCDDAIVTATTGPKVCPIVCRLHSYEVFADTPAVVQWAKVDCIVFVAAHIQEIFEARFGNLVPSSTQRIVIHNGVNLDQFGAPPGKLYGSKKVAYVGYINFKKNPGLLLQCFEEILVKDPTYTFHIAGMHRDERIRLYIEKYITDNKLPVVFHGWIPHVSLADWLFDKDFVISTSYLESFCYGIAEPMACGVVPLIHRWVGAEGLYADDFLFSSARQCAAQVVRFGQDAACLHVQGQRAAAYIQERFDANNITTAIESLCARLAHVHKL